MNMMPPTVVRPREVVQILRKHALLWVTPLLVCTLGASIYGLLRTPTWRATQTLYVRDEAIGKLGPPGRFDSADDRKAAQETILEVARNHAVVEAALDEAGPKHAARPSTAWPTADDIEQLQDVIRVTAPKGAEFGRTEVIYLSVDGPTPERAVALTRSVGDQLDARLRTLRNQRARSVIRELENTLGLARGDLTQATQRLEKIETEVGSDLGELRILNDAGAGDSNLRGTLNDIKTELRQAQTRQAGLEQQRKLLLAARDDPQQLIATPNQLLESQPALRRLKDGLVDAQLKTAELSGRMNNDHPLVKAATESERRVREDLHEEVEVALRGVSADLEVNEALIASLEDQQANVERRLDRLAQLRARYANLVADVQQRSKIVEDAQKELADARASAGAAQSASLLTRIDEPVVGNEPVGPGLGTIIAVGFGGGLMIGLGAVFLTVPIVRLRGRRWSDHFPGRSAEEQTGRRADDHADSRRAGDRPAADSIPATGRRATDPIPPTSALGTPAIANTANTASSGERRQEDRRRGDRRSGGEQEPQQKAPEPNTTAQATPRDTNVQANAPAAQASGSNEPAREATSSSPRMPLSEALRCLEERS